MSAAATAVTVFHPVPDAAGFDAWCNELIAVAKTAEGFVDSRVSVRKDAQLDWAVSVTFRSERLLHEWLDGTDRAHPLRDGASHGFHRLTSDVVMVEGAPLPPGIGVFRHSVARGNEADFENAQVRLVAKSSVFPGYEGTVVFPPDTSGEWLSLIRFRMGHQLSAWLQSRERAAALPELRAHLTEDFTQVAHTTPFGSTLRTENGETKMTPTWKTAMLILLVLYPTVMILSRFVGPILDRMGAGPWLALWLSQIASVGVMTWFFMPAVSAWFRRWLDPVDGSGVRISVIGAGVVLLVYAATLVLFASVKWLQYWDYN